MTGQPAVFLDRDGVLNEEVIDPNGVARAPTSPDELVMVPCAASALTRLHDEGFALVVVTNQPGVARGTLLPATVEAMHRILQSRLRIDAIEWCPHEAADDCECRKPRPGMILHAARVLELDLARSWLVGDRWVDIAAARSAGVRAILVEQPWSWRPTRAGSPPSMLAPDGRVPDVGAAADLILSDGAQNQAVGRRGRSGRRA